MPVGEDGAIEPFDAGFHNVLGHAVKNLLIVAILIEDIICKIICTFRPFLMSFIAIVGIVVVAYQKHRDLTDCQLVEYCFGPLPAIVLIVQAHRDAI